MILARSGPRLPLAAAGWHPAAWTALSVCTGLLLARLSPLAGVAVLGAVVLVTAAIWEPLAGLGLAMLLGPTRAYLFISFPTLPVDLGQAFFALALAGWLARSLAQRQIRLPRLPLLLPLTVYLAVGLVSLLRAISLEEGLRELIKWAEIGVTLVILTAETRRGRARALLAFVLLAGLAQAALALWQYQFRSTGPEHFQLAGGIFRAYGTFEQPNPLGGFLGLLWPVAAGLAWAALTPVVAAAARRLLTGLAAVRVAPAGLAAWVSRGQTQPRLWPGWAVITLPGFAAAVLLAGLFVTFSRGAWLGAAAAGLMLMVAAPRRPWQGLALVAVSGALVAALAWAGLLPASIAARLGDLGDVITVTDVRGVEIDASNFAIVERLAHWQAAAGMVRDFPWLGVGLGNYGPAYPRYALLNWPNALGHAHMIYLNVLAETGLVGLAAYLAFWASVVALTLRVIRRSDGLARGLAIGLLGAWAHVSVHQLFDNLYVNNVHFTLAGLFSLLVYLARSPHATPPAGASL
ncbi:MAG: O-antigen ligase family protein [Anaerolineales bacterium]|nr:O-antigen ligase family protein [Anaerolineales bacterium]